MDSNYFIDLKENGENLISKKNTDNITNIDKLVANFFTCQTYITKLLKARENILQQANSGKRGYFTFSYPNLGWVQYDHNSIVSLYKLAEQKPKIQLYNIYKNETMNQKLRLHAIAALIIKCGDDFYNLYNGLSKARQFTKDNRLVYIIATNPFSEFIKTNMVKKRYTGEEIIVLANIGISRRFNSIFP